MQGLHYESLWAGLLFGASWTSGSTIRLCISMIGISTTFCNEPKDVSLLQQ